MSIYVTASSEAHATMSTLRARLTAGLTPPADLRDVDRHVRNAILGLLLLVFVFFPGSLIRVADSFIPGQGPLLAYGMLAWCYFTLALNSLLVFRTRKSRAHKDGQS